MKTLFQRLSKYLVKQPPPYMYVFHSPKPEFVIEYKGRTVTGIDNERRLNVDDIHDSTESFDLNYVSPDDVSVYKKLAKW